jgi:NADH-quinone oxidoreductase subunit C
MELNKEARTLELLKEKFEDQILQIESPYNLLTVSLKAEKIIEVVQFLYNNGETQFQYLTTLCAIHYPDQNQIAVVYHLHNLPANQRIRLKIFLPIENPTTPTVTTIFAGANWLERETYDFFGVIFVGHPNISISMIHDRPDRPNKATQHTSLDSHQADRKHDASLSD